MTLATALAAGPLFTSLNCCDQGDPVRIWTQAQADLSADRLDAVAAAVDRLERLRPPTEEDRMLRAQLLKARGDVDGALGVLNKFPDDARLAPLARLSAGQLELRRDGARRAELHLRRALELDPRLVQARRELIYIYGMQLRQKDQDAQFHALAELVPLSFHDLFLWCLHRAASTWEPSELASHLRRFVERDPEDRESRLALAEVLRRLNGLEEAHEVLSELPGSDPEVRALAAELAADRGDLQEAARILSTGPADHPTLALRRGQLALRQLDAEQAVRHFRLAEAADPARREVVLGLARALQLSGREEMAARYHDRARKLDELNTLIEHAAIRESREDPGLPLRLGAACAAVGRRAEARGWYMLAISRNPLDNEAQRALFELQADAAESTVSQGSETMKAGRGGNQPTPSTPDC
jgi:Flp pilus assembly protein TadD